MTQLRNDIYIAHIRESDGAIQTVREHSLETAELAASFAIGLFGKIAYFAAILHDIGKYRPGFQKKISGENPNIRVEHSICGAMVVNEMYKEKRFAPLALLTKLCIAGHHSGIPDCGLPTDDENPEESTLYARLAREIPLSEYHAYQSDINIPEIDPGPFNELLTQDLTNNEHGRITFINKFAFFTRYIFSCLTDADSLDTAVFCSEKEEDRSVYADFRECLQKINAEFAKFTAITALQKTRGKLQQIVYEKIHQSAEIFFMNMPTGSGKTLCSMKFALERAIRGDKKRIIYVIPYNSIIDQTAQIFSNLFGESAFVLRHQSTFSYDNREDLDEDYRKTIRYATENWDAQIIITTVVQFFESVYGNKRGQLRKLHNIADSILIFDEAHILPVDYMQPCLEAIAFITKYLEVNCQSKCN